MRVLSSLALVAAAAAQSSVDLRDVKALTFRRGRMTASRRVPAVPQLSCVGGGACRSHSATIDAIQCTNTGADDFGDVQWRCDADLDPDVKLGDITVSCEGYSSSRDPLKLRGSCGLEFSLAYTRRDRGATGAYDARYFAEDHAARQTRYMSTTYDDPSASSASTVLFLCLALLALVVCLREQASRRDGAAGSRGHDRGGGWGYSGGGGGDGGHGGAGWSGGGVPFAATGGGAPAAGFWSGAAAGDYRMHADAYACRCVQVRGVWCVVVGGVLCCGRARDARALYIFAPVCLVSSRASHIAHILLLSVHQLAYCSCLSVCPRASHECGTQTLNPNLETPDPRPRRLTLRFARIAQVGCWQV